MKRTLGLLVAIMVVSPSAIGVPEGPSYPSAEWFAREALNFSRISEAPTEQANPDFVARWQAQSTANIIEYMNRNQQDPHWKSQGNLCSTWGQQCVGDPFLYPGVDVFYENEGDVHPVIYYDEKGARLSGRVWAPKSTDSDPLPGIVIETGSVQAPEPFYWWFAQTLVRAGYIAMTYDVRGQGRSDNRGLNNEFGSNFASEVFMTNLVDSVDFLRSSPGAPYQRNIDFASTGAPTMAYNPIHSRLDRERIGIVGHSLGATGVSVVQGLNPWTGTAGSLNPVDVAVAWDNHSTGSLGGKAVVARVPTMGQSADYGLVPTPFSSPPMADGKKGAFNFWKTSGVPTYQVVIQGGTHYEWSRIPNFPATSWHTWGNPIAEHYTLAWLDRWLKLPGEGGYDDSDQRLLSDVPHCMKMSFYYRSARFFTDRHGVPHNSEDIRAGCSYGVTP